MARRINAFGRPKTIATADVRDVLSFGKEAHFVRQVPFALLIGLLGLVMLFLRDGGMMGSFILIAAGFGYAGFAFWRRSNPAGPTLVLSPECIRYRVAGDHAALIPWDEVQAVDSADIYVKSSRFGSMGRRGHRRRAAAMSLTMGHGLAGAEPAGRLTCAPCSGAAT